MADINKRAGNDCDGERGERGHRGHRGHDGHDGATGPAGPTGPTGPTVQPEHWTRVANMSTGRAWHHMGLLPNGRAIVLGGSATGGQSQLASAEIFDVVTGTWMTAAPMPTPRVFPVVFHLPGGKILVCGGLTPFFNNPALNGPPPPFLFANGLTSSLIYDPIANTWTPTGLIPATNNYIPADGGARFPQIYIKGGLHDGDPFVVGGTGFEDPAAAAFFRWGGTRSAIRFDLVTQTWVSCAQMSVPRAYIAGACALGGGKVLVVGGISYSVNALAPLCPDQWTETAEVYDADANTWTVVDPLPVIAGEMSGVYPIVAPPLTPPGYQARRMFGRALNIGPGKALIVGGSGPVALNTPVAGPPFVCSRPRATCWVFDINKAPGSQWRQSGSMAAGRCYPAVFQLPDGTVVAAGGIDELWSPGNYMTELWDPITETWRQGPDLPLSVPQPPGAQRPQPIFAGLSWGAGERLTTGELFVAGAHQEGLRIDQILESVFFNGGETAVPFAAKFLSGSPAPGTPPGTPLAPAAVDAGMAFFLNFPLVG